MTVVECEAEWALETPSTKLCVRGPERSVCNPVSAANAARSIAPSAIEAAVMAPEPQAVPPALTTLTPI